MIAIHTREAIRNKVFTSYMHGTRPINVGCTAPDVVKRMALRCQSVGVTIFHSEAQLYSEYDKDTAATFQERRRNQRLHASYIISQIRVERVQAQDETFGNGRAQDLPRLGCEGAMHVATASNFGGANIVRPCMQFGLRCWSEVVSRHTVLQQQRCPFWSVD
jgi:hypothetical protein